MILGSAMSACLSKWLMVIVKKWPRMRDDDQVDNGVESKTNRASEK